MKVRITKELPAPVETRPKIGDIVDVVEVRKTPLGKKLYILDNGIWRASALETECELVE